VGAARAPTLSSIFNFLKLNKGFCKVIGMFAMFAGIYLMTALPVVAKETGPGSPGRTFFSR